MLRQVLLMPAAKLRKTIQLLRGLYLAVQPVSYMPESKDNELWAMKECPLRNNRLVHHPKYSRHQPFRK